ncbi:MAG TPA: hypothetical protein VJ842_06565 [Pyrinomonadaceae bacterium]|nr:hypothetical protein [Pyrinomonadaceae bacterium]
MDDEQDKKTAKEWKPTSERTDAIQYILAAADCPKQVRTLINILVGISNGFPEFETTQREIASRISGEMYSSSDENAKQWVKRAHRELKKWQGENQLNLLEYEAGGRSKDKTRIYKSRYRLHIIAFADKVIARAQENHLWDKNKQQALETEARELRDEYWPIPVMYHRSQGNKKPVDELRKYLVASITYMRKAHEILDKDKTVILLEQEVIEEFEETLKELKKRLLSEDSFK